MMQDKELISTFKDSNLFRHREIQIGDQMTTLIETIKQIEPTIQTDNSRAAKVQKKKIGKFKIKKQIGDHFDTFMP